jgi:hypothetical protein
MPLESQWEDVSSSPSSVGDQTAKGRPHSVNEANF